jgi:hypothetical protein
MKKALVHPSPHPTVAVPKPTLTSAWGIRRSDPHLLTSILPRTLIPSLCVFPPSHLGPQFRYKTRVYKQTNLDEKQLAKLHTKVRDAHWHGTLCPPPPGAPARCVLSTALPYHPAY